MLFIHILIRIVTGILRYIRSFFAKNQKTFKLVNVSNPLQVTKELLKKYSSFNSSNTWQHKEEGVVNSVGLKNVLPEVINRDVYWWQWFNRENEELEFIGYPALSKNDELTPKKEVVELSKTALEEFEYLSKFHFSLSYELFKELNLLKLNMFLRDEVWSLLCANINASPLTMQFEAANEFIAEEEPVFMEIYGVDEISPTLISFSHAEKEMYRRQKLDDENTK